MSLNISLLSSDNVTEHFLLISGNVSKPLSEYWHFCKHFLPEYSCNVNEHLSLYDRSFGCYKPIFMVLFHSSHAINNHPVKMEPK